MQLSYSLCHSAKFTSEDLPVDYKEKYNIDFSVFNPDMDEFCAFFLVTEDIESAMKRYLKNLVNSNDSEKLPLFIISSAVFDLGVVSLGYAPFSSPADSDSTFIVYIRNDIAETFRFKYPVLNSTDLFSVSLET